MIETEQKNFGKSLEAEKLGYLPFDPEKEIAGFFQRQGKNGEEGINSREKRKSKLAVLKENLSRQKRGIAKVIADIEKITKTGSRPKREDLFGVFEKAAPIFRFSEKQLEAFRNGIERYLERRQIIEKYVEHYEGDWENFFQDVFQFSPHGKISVEPGGIVINIICHDIEDFGELYYERPYHSLPEKEKKGVDQIAGFYPFKRGVIPELHGLIAVEKREESEFDIGNKIAVHEEQHAIKNFFERETAGEKYFDQRIKDEVLAFYKDGTDLYAIKETLCGHAAYRHVFDDFLRHYRIKSQEADSLDGEDEAVKSEYEKLIWESTEAVRKMTGKGLKRNEIVHLLLQEPLSAWPKMAERIVGYERENISESKTDSSQDETSRTDWEILEKALEKKYYGAKY